ncbi:HesA/MoeB/ThiF family protein [Microbacterium azadirachtae]|uniref:HesA/MoeB/ThiF family protein n=1 Tax=Microbacterium azadirachtae TaxID=582680 RepID=UPI000886DAA7|nr:ThiF family adenylyltransferase [Microbacterium azadirachtae]SDM18312.1 Molybdopterin or thiamine biosynthesis adenylyltransferase [Microbacterium azadirachtae]SEG41191.1 Molybdopterin or thiamine biosynthesis adenylyltransferase [Microbacterium azadirachtae]SEG44165.1 Molybdopterin or thiamine biosynthesis adenylyltransferase [Microbacterium azadirachtae]
MPESPPPFVFDQSAFEHFCAELVGAGFSPVPGSARAIWVGALPESLKPLTDARTIRLRIPNGWPARAAKVAVAGLATEHATSDEGDICLWSNDDPAQIRAQTWGELSARIENWAERATGGFHAQDRALDAWAYYRPLSARSTELNLRDLLGSNPRNGDLHVVYGSRSRLLTVTRLKDGDHPLQGVIMFRNSVRSSPRDLEQLFSSLTRRQRENLKHGLSRRQDVVEGTPSTGYDFAILAWPKHEQLEAVAVSFEGTAPALVSRSHVTSPNDHESRLRRAGPDAEELSAKRVVVIGIGSVGSQVALTLASSGTGNLVLIDHDDLRSVNLVRHVLPEYLVGHPKALGMTVRLEGTAPWCKVETNTGALPLAPARIATLIHDADIVIDCTGDFAVTLAVAEACEATGIPLVSGSLARGGQIIRVQAQLPGGTPILQRSPDDYPRVPPEPSTEPAGFLELGCTAPVNNAPPAVVTRAAADLAMSAIDILMARPLQGDEIVTVLRAIETTPFDVIGIYIFPTSPQVAGR